MVRGRGEIWVLFDGGVGTRFVLLDPSPED